MPRGGRRSGLSRALTPAHLTPEPLVLPESVWGRFCVRRHASHRRLAVGQPIAITRTDLTASELRAQAGGIGDGAAVRRLLAIAVLLEGHSGETAAFINGMTGQR